jgi:hypothetical protein
LSYSFKYEFFFQQSQLQIWQTSGHRFFTFIREGKQIGAIISMAAHLRREKKRRHYLTLRPEAQSGTDVMILLALE